MASKAEEEEGKIPVFSVLKNNTILKNIFIVNKPLDPSPSPLPSPSTTHVDVLLVGRHPDCDLMLTHPSISRFHLQIRSTPSSLSLSIIDLSSVHGTWVSGMKVEPGVSVEMKEGDTLKIGVSSRVYRLHWIPISRAYDLENPFVSRLDVVAEEEEQEEEEVEERKQSLKNCCPVEIEEIGSMDSILDCISPLYLDENPEVNAENEIPAAPPMPEVIVSFRKSPSKDETSGVVIDTFGAETLYLTTTSNLPGSPNDILNVKKEIPSAPPVPENIISSCCEGEVKNQSGDETFGVLSSFGEFYTPRETQQFYTPRDTLTSPEPSGLQDSFEKHCSSLLINNDHASLDEKSSAEAIIPTESEFKCTIKDNGRVTDISAAGVGVFNSENTFLPVEDGFPDTNCQQIKFVEEVAVDGEKQDTCGDEYKPKMQSHLNTKSSYEQGHLLDGVVKDTGNQCCSGISSASLQVESVNSMMPTEAALKITEEVHTLQSDRNVLGSCIEAMAKSSSNGNIWSRRGKAYCAPQVRTSKSIVKSTANVDTEVAMSKKKGIINNKTISKNLFSVLDGEEDDYEIFTPDKENFSPNTLQLRCLKMKGKAGKLEETKHSQSQRSHISKDIYPDEVISPTSSKESQKDLLSVFDGGKEIFTPNKENFSPNTHQLHRLKQMGDLEEIKCSKGQWSQTSESKLSSNVYPDENIIPSSSKENQKDLLSLFDGEKEVFTPNKENFSPDALQLHRLKQMGDLEEIKCSKGQWSQTSESKFNSNIYPNENISPTANKENQTPKVAQEHKSRRKPFGSLELAQRSQRSKSKFSANVYPDVGISRTSKKEDTPPKVAQEHKLQRKPFGSHIELAKEQDTTTLNNKAERVPFQLLMNAGGGKSISETSCPDSAPKSIDISNCGDILDKHINPYDISWEQKRRWDMVVDTASLVSKDSRQALQLLEGLKGTRLIIPRLVLKELDSMKGQYSIFRRISEASLALEWIEECMAKTSWWIHITSSMEEERLIAPTPPAYPRTHFSEESCSMELASPTAEDHILDFAVLYRRKQNAGQLVLLSEDITLKIKCMTEGLLCETAQEFRESLVNPFSGRFRWTDSSPRGQTWSCQDDVVLRERYFRLPTTRRKSSKGVASGLKLILLHNSQYRQ